MNTNYPSIDKALHFRPIATGILQAVKGEKRSFRNQVACAGALAALPIDRTISIVAFPFITMAEHFEEIKQSKGRTKAFKIIATPIWLPINIALKTAVFALFAFFRLPLEIYRGIQRLFRESPEALKREYTGRFMYGIRGRYCQLDVKEEKVILEGEVQPSYHKIVPFSGTEIFASSKRAWNENESDKKLIYAMKEAKIKKTPFTSVYVVTLGDSGGRRPERALNLNTFKDGPLAVPRDIILSIPTKERAKVLILWEANSMGLENYYKGLCADGEAKMQKLFQWKAAYNTNKDASLPVGASMYFMGRQESANLRYGILSKNLEKALRGSE